MRRLLMLLLVMLGVVANAQQKGSFGIAYYNVDKLYDTIPSRFYDDGAYTPAGKFGWDSRRYHKKIDQVAAVIDSMALPVVALFGVENEQVVRDIVSACGEDYAYIHRTSNRYDGLDFALLYFVDYLYPDRVAEHRGALCVEGKMVDDTPLTIIATNRSTSLGVLLEEQKSRADNKIIIIGDAGELNFKKYALRDAFAGVESAGRGNRISRGMWELRDRALVNFDASFQRDVYARRWLLDRYGEPQPTFKGAKYCAGVSSCLPIYIYFEKIFAH